VFVGFGGVSNMDGKIKGFVGDAINWDCSNSCSQIFIVMDDQFLVVLKANDGGNTT